MKPALPSMLLVALLASPVWPGIPAAAQTATEVPPPAGFTPKPRPPEEYPDEVKELLARAAEVAGTGEVAMPGAGDAAPSAAPGPAMPVRRLPPLRGARDLPPADFAETRRALAHLERERVAEIARTVDPDSRDGSGRPLLHFYVEHAGRAGLAALLSAGADPDARDYATGQTPLLLAVLRGDAAAAEQLLAAGADPNLKDDAGRPPLFHARERGHPGLAALLLKSGAREADALPVAAVAPPLPAAASPEPAPDGPAPAVHFHPAARSPLLSGYKPGVDFAAARAAADRRDAAELVRIARTCDPESRDAKGGRLIHLLVRQSRALGTEPLLALLLSGADVEAVEGGSGATPLTLAASAGADVALRLLVARGAAVDRADETGLTPLAAARRAGYEAVAQALLAAGARDAGAAGSAGMPVAAGSPTVAGVAVPPPPEPIDLPASGGKSYADFSEVRAALADKDGAKLRELIGRVDPDSRDGEGRRLIHHLLDAGRKDALAALLEAGADPDAIDETTGRRPLATVCEKGDAATVDLLLSRGARPDEFGEDGLTPLMHAAVNGRVEVARRLLDAGARADATDDGGSGALLLASGGTGVDASTIVTLLLERGADANARDASGETPLVRARRAKNQKAVDALLAAGAKEEPPPEVTPGGP